MNNDEQAEVTTLPSHTYRANCGHGKAFITITRNHFNVDPATPSRIIQVFVKISSTIRSTTVEQQAYDVVCDRAEAEVIGKLASTALIAGVDAQEIAALLRGTNCGHPYITPNNNGALFGGETILSMSDLVGRVLLLDIAEHETKHE